MAIYSRITGVAFLAAFAGVTTGSNAAARFVKLHRDLWAGWEGTTDILQVMGPEVFSE
jgi:hypothetical protein